MQNDDDQDDVSGQIDTTQLKLSRRMDGVSDSATLKLNAKVQAMKAQGIPVINLTAGEPDFWVPVSAKEAAIEAIHSNQSRYLAVSGMPELRKLIAERTNRQQPSLSGSQLWDVNHVLVSNGAKHSLFNAVMSVLDFGDEVLIPAPYWLTYPEIVKIAGGKPKILPTSAARGFKITPDQLRQNLSSKVRVLILNSPANPTGAMYSKTEFQEIGQILNSTPGGKGVWVISDEIYDRYVYGQEPFCSFLEAVPELRNRTITINGMSKSYAMTGWRIGWSVAPEGITQGMCTLQGQSTSNVNNVAQIASIAALKIPEGDLGDQIQTFKARRDLCLEILKKAGKIEWCPPEGAFYLFMGIGKYFLDVQKFAMDLLENERVAVVPGSSFGDEKSIRLSFATDEKSLEEGCKRILGVLTKSDV